MEEKEMLGAMYKNFLAVSITAISRDTAARICAILYVHGNNEAFTQSVKLLSDLKYIQERYGIFGGGLPDKEFGRLFRKYVNALELYYDGSKGYCHWLETENKPQWAKDLFLKRYGIKLKDFNLYGN